MRLLSRALSALFLLPSLHALAQTYTPKTIRVEAPPTVDAAEALHLAALPANSPLTKQQIEAALQRLADTGLFSDVAYTVDASALVLKLTPAATNNVQPARFSNFVWWQPAQLESLLEAAVPAYHGKLPVSGTLTDQVKAALISLLHTKGVDDANVQAHQTGANADTVTLAIITPLIVIDHVQFQNALPSLQPQLKTLADRLHGQDFDTAAAAKTLKDSVGDIYQNAGFLTADVSAPTTSVPHKDLADYAVDLTSTITPGDIFHLTNISIHAQPPVSQPDLEKTAHLKPGDIASPAAQRLARAEMQKLYVDQGFYDAKVLFTTHDDFQAHTVEYAVNIAPGQIYHLASIDASALALDQQTAFAHAFHPHPGAVADANLRTAIQQALQSLNLGFPVSLQLTPDPSSHTVTIALNTGTHRPNQ